MSNFDTRIEYYYTELENKLKDPRDNRGKRHNLAVVFLLFMYAIIRSSGYLNYYKIYRQMKRDVEFIQNKLGLEQKQCISYAQLRRILSMIDYQEFNEINDRVFGKTIKKKGREWKSIDGKELRGTIDKIAGKKRGENLVQQVFHADKENKVIGFYNGSKESEKTTVKQFFGENTDFAGEAFTLDALHTDTSLLETINEKNGTYLVQVKGNQKKLLMNCEHTHKDLEAKHQFSSLDKGHGRLEIRNAHLYDFNVDGLDDRWKNSGIQSLISIERERTILKTGKISNETVYFISNLSLNPIIGEELFNAVRNHWKVEADHYVRDVTLGEDKIQCLKKNLPRVMAIAIGTILNLLRRKNKNNNMRELREDLVRNRRLANQCFCG